MRTIVWAAAAWCGVIAGATLATRLHAESSTSRYLDSSDGRDWPGYGRTFGEQHYSPLEQINQANVGRLGLEWSMDLGPESSVTQPIAVAGVLYFATGYSLVHAVDAASGKLLWRYNPKAAEAAGSTLHQGGWGSRGIAWWNGKIYAGTYDGRLIALDAKTGALLWSVQTFDTNIGAAYITGAPRVFDGKVIIGSGNDVGGNRGYVTAYDAENGQQLWRFYTVPGDPAKGFENSAMQMAAKTWAGEWWKAGGGGLVWNAMAYDPESDLVYLGTGNGTPHNRRARSEDRGDNLFLTSIVALKGKTGEYRWHYQVTPGDTWDYEPVADIELADLVIAGKTRKVLMQASKNGFFYVLDRLTGELLSAEPYAKVTWASRIDLKSGRPVENAGARYPNGRTVEIWPSGWGAHGWLPMSYSPKVHFAYIPVVEMGMKLNDRGIDLKSGPAPTDRTVNPGYNAEQLAGTGALIAWDPVAQKPVWKLLQPTIVNGGVMSTAGDLVFQGTVDGTFNAYSATSGKRLWSFAAQTPVFAPPLSYAAVNGSQFVTVLTGLGTMSALIAAAQIEKYGIDPRSQARRVLTFALEGHAKLPSPAPVRFSAVEDPGFKADAHSAEAGRATFARNCALCHGGQAIGVIQAPDLRRSAIPLSAETFTRVVRDGALVSKGMPAFGGLTDEQLVGLRQYIRTEAQRLRDNSHN